MYFLSFINTKSVTMKFKLFYIVALLFVFSGCNNPDRSNEVARVDSLITELAGINDIIFRIDSNEINKKYSEYQVNINIIRANFEDKDDRTDELVWSAITHYGSLRKPLRNYYKRMPDIKKEILFSAGKLDTLKMDLRKNRLSDAEFKKYFVDESDNITALRNAAEITISQAEVELKRFDSLNPIIIGVIEKMKNK